MYEELKVSSDSNIKIRVLQKETTRPQKDFRFEMERVRVCAFSLLVCYWGTRGWGVSTGRFPIRALGVVCGEERGGGRNRGCRSVSHTLRNNHI